MFLDQKERENIASIHGEENGSADTHLKGRKTRPAGNPLLRPKEGRSSTSEKGDPASAEKVGFATFPLGGVRRSKKTYESEKREKSRGSNAKNQGGGRGVSRLEHAPQRAQSTTSSQDRMHFLRGRRREKRRDRPREGRK